MTQGTDARYLVNCPQDSCGIIGTWGTNSAANHHASAHCNETGHSVDVYDSKAKGGVTKMTVKVSAREIPEVDPIARKANRSADAAMIARTQRRKAAPVKDAMVKMFDDAANNVPVDNRPKMAELSKAMDDIREAKPFRAVALDESRKSVGEARYATIDLAREWCFANAYARKNAAFFYVYRDGKDEAELFATGDKLRAAQQQNVADATEDDRIREMATIALGVPPFSPEERAIAERKTKGSKQYTIKALGSDGLSVFEQKTDVALDYDQVYQLLATVFSEPELDGRGRKVFLTSLIDADGQTVWFKL